MKLITDAITEATAELRKELDAGADLRAHLENWRALAGEFAKLAAIRIKLHPARCNCDLCRLLDQFSALKAK